MAGRNSVESSIKLIISKLKSDLPTQLASVRTGRGDAYVTTEPPVSYFHYENAQGYKTPAVFVIADNVDFELNKGQNTILSKIRVNVSAIIEDRDGDHLTIKSWRYQDAIHKALDQADLAVGDNTVRIICRVTKASFSPLYRKQKDDKAVENTFRKEVLLEMDVHHFEQP